MKDLQSAISEWLLAKGEFDRVQYRKWAAEKALDELVRKEGLDVLICESTGEAIGVSSHRDAKSVIHFEYRLVKAAR